MSALTKKRHTEVQIQIGKSRYVFDGVPESKLKPIVVSLKEYKTSTPWRDLYQDKFAKQGGEVAYCFLAAREREGLTQAQLADKLGMLQSHISEIEHGKRVIGKKLAKKIGTIFKLDYRVFL